jgi:hypothetical protein
MWGFSPRDNKNNTAETYQSLVQVFFPTEKKSIVEDMGTYMMWLLDHRVSIQLGLSLTTIPLSDATAELLDAGARQLVAKNKETDRHPVIFNEGSFASLSGDDRFRALALLEQLNIDLRRLPTPYRYNTGLVQFMIDFLNRSVMLGYYSECPGYGSRKFNIPDERELEQFPPSWDQVGYPGPALGYRDFRGYLL